MEAADSKGQCDWSWSYQACLPREIAAKVGFFYDDDPDVLEALKRLGKDKVGAAGRAYNLTVGTAWSRVSRTLRELMSALPDTIMSFGRLGQPGNTMLFNLITSAITVGLGSAMNIYIDGNVMGILTTSFTGIMWATAAVIGATLLTATKKEFTQKVINAVSKLLTPFFWWVPVESREMLVRLVSMVVKTFSFAIANFVFSSPFVEIGDSTISSHPSSLMNFARASMNKVGEMAKEAGIDEAVQAVKEFDQAAADLDILGVSTLKNWAKEGLDAVSGAIRQSAA